MKGTDKIIHFVQRYKLLHTAFWLWIYIDLIHQQEVSQKEPMEVYLITSLIIVISQMLCVYFTVYVLIPRLLNRNKYFYFALAAFGAIIGFSLISACLQDVYYHSHTGKYFRSVLFHTVTDMVDMIVMTTVFIAVVIIAERYNKDQKNKRLEREKLETELNFLRAQINPHFLFNALNSIFVLIGMDRKKAEDTLLKFSSLLRYQLYECSDNKVEINKELNFLDNYISLEKIRNNDNLEVVYEFSDKYYSFRIAPFILIPFVENAFKFASANGQKNRIVIRAAITETDFNFFVSNTFNPVEVKSREGGIGLQNVKRRLELIYPDEHELNITKADGVFTINLKLWREA